MPCTHCLARARAAVHAAIHRDKVSRGERGAGCAGESLKKVSRDGVF